MKLLLALFSVSMGIVVAAPAYADPDVDAPPGDANNGVFLSDLHQVGITFGDPNQALKAGKTVCGLLSHGESGLQLVSDLKDNNPALNTNGAVQFATISAKSFCPQQLGAAEKPSGMSH